MTTEVLRRGRQAARVGPWRGADATALVTPAPGLAGTVTSDFLRWCAESLAARGYQRVVSAALLHTDATPYVAAGFEVLEELHLLSRTLTGLPDPPASPARLRRGRRRDISAVVAVDNRAFPPFWAFDGGGIDDARTITARSRFRVAVVGGKVTGYAITGLGEHQGYLQRLAVDPACQRVRIGSLLVVDALRWLARRQASRAMVNTQVGNDAALATYLSLGFALEPVRLEVLVLRL